MQAGARRVAGWGTQGCRRVGVRLQAYGCQGAPCAVRWCVGRCQSCEAECLSRLRLRARVWLQALARVGLQPTAPSPPPLLPSGLLPPSVRQESPRTSLAATSVATSTSSPQPQCDSSVSPVCRSWSHCQCTSCRATAPPSAGGGRQGTARIRSPSVAFRSAARAAATSAAAVRQCADHCLHCAWVSRSAAESILKATKVGDLGRATRTP